MVPKDLEEEGKQAVARGLRGEGVERVGQEPRDGGGWNPREWKGTCIILSGW